MFLDPQAFGPLAPVTTPSQPYTYRHTLHLRNNISQTRAGVNWIKGFKHQEADESIELIKLYEPILSIQYHSNFFKIDFHHSFITCKSHQGKEAPKSSEGTRSTKQSWSTKCICNWG